LPANLYMRRFVLGWKMLGLERSAALARSAIVGRTGALALRRQLRAIITNEHRPVASRTVRSF
jgi:hypothetical protein